MKKLLIILFLVIVNGSKFTAQTSVYIKGTGLNYNSSREVKLNGQNVACTSGRGLCLTIITAGTHQHLSSTVYDTYGSTVASDNLAIALNNLQRGQIGILTSYDAWEENVTQNLKSAARRLGLYKLGGGLDYNSRRPYAAIFRGSGTATNNTQPNHIAYEVMQSKHSGAERAVIATWLIEDAFIGNNITNALVSGDGNISGASVMVDDLGNVGIGTTSPQSLLELNAQTNGDAVLKLEADVNNSNEANNSRIEMYQDGGLHGAFIGFNSDWGGNQPDNLFRIGTRASGINKHNNITIDAFNGNVGIGTDTADSKLTVAGNIHAQEVKVTVDAGADFVFEDDYKLTSLETLETFIRKNKHLPEIASEKEMQANGLQLAEINIKLLQKIEELTLYVIEQNKEMKILEERFSKYEELLKNQKK